MQNETFYRSTVGWSRTIANHQNNQNYHDPDHDTSQKSQQDNENQADDHGDHQAAGEDGHTALKPIPPSSVFSQWSAQLAL